MKPERPEITKKAYATAVRLIQAFDYIDEQEKKNKTRAQSKGSVLVFLPGLHEIEEMNTFLEMMKKTEYKYVSFQHLFIKCFSFLRMVLFKKIFSSEMYRIEHFIHADKVRYYSVRSRCLS